MTVNVDIRDDFIDRSVDLELYKKGLVKKLIPILNKVTKDIQAQLLEHDITGYKKTRINLLLKDIRKIKSSAYQSLIKKMEGDLKKLAPMESLFVVASVNSSVGASYFTSPATGQIYAAAVAKPFNGKLLSEWASGLEASAFNRVSQQIRIGYIEGETISQISSRIKRSVNADRTNVEAIARTAVAHISSYASEQTYLENKDLIKAVQWSSTLDTRTTPICQTRDGKLYEIGEGPRPPAHINCRSKAIPVLSFDSGEGTRASIDGQVPEDITYGEWLKKQSKTRQEEVLGKRKAELFRSTDLEISQFSTGDGRPLTLEQLEKRYPKKWEKTFKGS